MTGPAPKAARTTKATEATTKARGRGAPATSRRAPAPVPAAVASGTARPTTRPVGATRPRRGSSALEREADRTADAVLAGAVDLARNLTPTPPARRVLPASPGRPLPAAVRARLEESLGADLSRVRVHTDAAAHRLVAEEGASAFAAGPDVFFGAGEYQPGTDEGLHLLAHELAHTLQQAGRAAADGRRRVADARGSGEVQAADPFHDRLTSLTPRGVFVLLSQDHGALSPSTPVGAYQAVLSGRLGQRVDPTEAAYQRLVEDVLAGVGLPADGAELSFLLDVLKAGKAWEAAATLIETAPVPLGTVRLSTEFANWLTVGGHRTWAWPAEALELPDATALREFRDHSLGAFRIFLVRPDSAPYLVENAKAEAMLAAPAWATTTLVPDEQVQIAAARLLTIDKARYEMCRRADAKAGSGSAAADPQEREFFGHAVFRGLRRALVLEPLVAEWIDLVKGKDVLGIQAGAWFAERRLRAEEFWTTAQRRWGAEHEVRSGLVRGNLVPEDVRARMRQALVANPVAAKAAKAVTAAGVEFLDADRADLPVASAYAARVTKLAKVVEDQTRVVLRDLSHYRLDLETRARADLVPWLVFRLELLRLATRRYEAKADTSRFEDTRHGHRLRMSGELQVLAIELGDALLEAECLSVQHNEAGGRTRLVLVGNWEAPARSDLDQLAKDFKEGVRFAPSIVFDSRAVAAFYKEAYLRRLGDEIETMLAPAAAVSSPDRLVLKEAAALAASTQQARRWTVKDYDWAPHPDEKDTVKDLVAGHPKSREQLPPLTEVTTVAYPGESATANLATVPHLPEVFAWELPAWDRLALEAALAMVQLPELQHLAPVGTDGMAWLRRAAEYIATNELAITGKVEARIAARLDERWQVQRRRLGVDALPPGLLRQATNHDRAIVARVAARHLTTYDATVGTWKEPTRALQLVDDFHQYALPTTDNLPQTAALVIEIAGAMREAFVKTYFGEIVEEDRYDLVTGFYGFVLIAQDWLRDPTKRARLTQHFTRLSADDLAKRAADLDAVRAAFDTVRRRVQTRRGFETEKGGLRSLNYPFIVTTEDVFGGAPAYQLMRVLYPHGFRFHPKYGEQGPALGGQQMGAYSEATVTDLETGKPIDPTTELLEIRINERPVVLRAGNLMELDLLWRAVEEKAFALSMENLQAAMEATLTLALDAAELIPGAGQALAVGRVVVSIGTFLMSADFDDIKEIVSGDLEQQIRDLVQHLKDLLSPDELWMLLLFDLDLGFLGRLAQKDAKDSHRAKRARRRKGRLGRLLSALLGLGTLIARQVELMHERVQPPLRNAQSFVVSHPVVATVVGLAADAMEYGAEVASPEIVQEFADDPAKAFKARVEELVAAIEGFELPKVIIPDGVLIEAIIGLVLDRFGAKGKLIRKALDVTGAMAEIARMVADALPEAASPNKLWVDLLRPEVDAVLQALRRDLIDGIYGALEQVGVTGVVRPAHQPVTAKLTESPVAEDEDAAPALAPGRSPRALTGLPTYGGDVIPPGPGAPLPAGPRASAEAGLGRSFDHVRLHRRPLGEGVDALTRGSHVVVRPGLPLDQGRGAHVLRHELAHVVQQTGDRPPGPTRGRPGPTVRLDPGAESAAEHAAAAGTVGGPHIGADAAAPAMSKKVLGRVLNRLADYQDLREFQEEIQGKISHLPSLTAPQKEQVKAFETKLKKALESPTLKVSGVPKGIGKVDSHAVVRDHASNAALRLAGMDKPYPDALVNLFRQALREDRSVAKKKGTSAPREFVVVPSQLSALVEGYLLIRTGLVTTVDLPRTSALFAASLTGGLPLDLKVTGVFLGGATKASPLWRPILERQLKKKNRLYGATRKGLARNEFLISDDAAQDRIFQAVVARIRARGPRFKAMHLQYELVETLVEEAVDESLSPKGTALPATDLPSPTKYVGTTIGTLGRKEIGLRVDTHKRLGSLGVPDRESHHTTQYLFAEYLTNRVDGLQPFAAAREPGLTYLNKQPNVLFRADGGKAINLGGLAGTASGRGEPMPAIYVSEHTHQRAGLHVDRKATLLPDGSKSSASQGNTVDGWFRARVPAAATAQELATTGTTPMAVTSFTPAQVQRNKDLVDGVLHVYSTMRKHMMKALSASLDGYERPYYESLAASLPANLDAQGRLKQSWQLSPADLNRVFATARRKNDEIMEQHGVKP